jgi:hypothetical protein
VRIATVSHQERRSVHLLTPVGAASSAADEDGTRVENCQLETRFLFASPRLNDTTVRDAILSIFADTQI